MSEGSPAVSRLGALYDRVYSALCGEHPDYRLWHFQYLFLRQTHAWQRQRMGDLKGHVLDVGCGRKPYERWVSKDHGGVTRYTGLDLEAGEGVDILVGPDDIWPIADASIDAIVFTQVLEHVADRPHVIGQMARVLKPGGTLLLTAPFLFMAHGLPHDYARFTTAGVLKLFEDDFEIHEVAGLGRAGAVIGNLQLTFIDALLNGSRVTRLLKGVLLPFWILYCLLTNAACRVIDAIDGTGNYYANVGMVARRKGG